MIEYKTLYFDFHGIWTAEGGRWGCTWGWKIFSPEGEQIGFVHDCTDAYFVTSESLGIRSVQRNTVEKAVYVIAFHWYKQEEIKKTLDKKRQG